MAELIVFVRSNGESKKLPGPGGWMDELSVEKISELTVKKADFGDKYDRRIIAGDVCDVREDGWWEWCQKQNPDNRMKTAFAVIRIPGKADDWKWAMDSHTVDGAWDGERQRYDKVIVKRARYNTLHYLQPGEVLELKIAKKLNIKDKATDEVMSIG